VRAQLPIRNVNRVVGTITGSEITKKYGPEGLPDDTMQIHFKGSAGQSFGAFMPRGMTFGSREMPTIIWARDSQAAKSWCSAGRIHVRAGGEHHHRQCRPVWRHRGEVYIRGMAGERFAVRNSGVDAVVEAVGDHGCEYMTGGHVVVLGPAGRNFGAGMSGGVAYVLDEVGDFPIRVNKQMVASNGWRMRKRSRTCAQ
jgi:glutamate synthase (NADPH/NADH) large chain